MDERSLGWLDIANDDFAMRRKLGTRRVDDKVLPEVAAVQHHSGPTLLREPTPSSPQDDGLALPYEMFATTTEPILPRV